MHHDDREASLRDLFTRLSEEVKRIVRTDLALMRTEFKIRIKSLKLAMILIASGAFLMIVGVLALAATLIIALSYAVPAWLAALIVGILLSAAGGGMAFMGARRLGRTDWTPTETVETLKEEGAWLRERLA